jgi:hypothetical protein
MLSSSQETCPWLVCVNLQQAHAPPREEVGGFAQLLAAARRARWPVLHCLHRPLRDRRPSPPIAVFQPLVSEPVFFHGAGAMEGVRRLSEALAGAEGRELFLMGPGPMSGELRMLIGARRAIRIPVASGRDCVEALRDRRLAPVVGLANDP